MRHGTKSTLPTICHQTGHQPPLQQWARTLLAQFRMAKNHPTLPWHPLLAPAWCHPPLSAPPPEATRAGLQALALAPAPTIPTSSHPQARHAGVGHLAPAPPVYPGPAHAKTPPPLMSSSMALAVATEGALQRPYSCSGRSGCRTFAQCPKHGAGCPPLLSRDGQAGGKHGGGKAIAALAPWGCSSVPTTPPSLPPNQLWGLQWLGSLWPLGRASHQCCLAGHWLATG